MECCGVDGANDWQQKPLSCCHKVTKRAQPPEDFHCRDARPGDDILYEMGCYDKLYMKADSNAKVLIGVGIGIAFVEVNIFFNIINTYFVCIQID